MVIGSGVACTADRKLGIGEAEPVGRAAQHNRDRLKHLDRGAEIGRILRIVGMKENPAARIGNRYRAVVQGIDPAAAMGDR